MCMALLFVCFNGKKTTSPDLYKYLFMTRSITLKCSRVTIFDEMPPHRFKLVRGFSNPICDF